MSTEGLCRHGAPLHTRYLSCWECLSDSSLAKELGATDFGSMSATEPQLYEKEHVMNQKWDSDSDSDSEETRDERQKAMAVAPAYCRDMVAKIREAMAVGPLGTKSPIVKNEPPICPGAPKKINHYLISSSLGELVRQDIEKIAEEKHE